MFAANGGGISIDAVTAIILAACAIATLALAVSLRSRRRTRSRWRAQDRAEGWVDDRGRPHIGAVDVVLGYTDENGKWHEGHDVIVPRILRQLEERDRDRPPRSAPDDGQ